VGLKILILAVVATGGLTGGVAFACEPIGEPKPWYLAGLAQFVAVASSPRAMVFGRNVTRPPG
jgi:hypothetical protein